MYNSLLDLDRSGFVLSSLLLGHESFRDAARSKRACQPSAYHSLDPVLRSQATSDTLSRHLEDLCRPGAAEKRDADGERSMLDHAEAFSRFMNDIYSRIALLLAKG